MEATLEQTDEMLLDNPIWYSLAGHHAALSIGGVSAKRYPPDIVPFAGFPNTVTPNFVELAKIMTVGETALVPNVPLPQASGFVSEYASDSGTQQFVCRATTINGTANHDIRDLNGTDVPDMLRLVEITHPGPFLPRTILLGRYAGIRKDGNLVAMAGERLHPGRFCEVSAVCTDPAFVGRGYATQLVTYLIIHMLERGDIPFLHVSSANDRAIRLYRKLGFVWRVNFPLQVIKFAGFDGSTAIQS